MTSLQLQPPLNELGNRGILVSRMGFGSAPVASPTRATTEEAVVTIQYALEQTGRKVPAQGELLWCIGPPLHHSFARIDSSASEAEVWNMVTKYRERFVAEGMFENSVCSGFPELLVRLKNMRHYVATSKPQVFAKKILAHFRLDQHFVNIYGSELNGDRSKKGELIQHVLTSETISADSSVMIGDRMHDILGAKNNGMNSIGVTWGYGDRAELLEAGANFIFEGPEELGDFLLS